MATQREVGAHLDLSQGAVSELAQAGIIKPANGRGSYSVNDCRVAYIRHLREIAAGRAGGDPDAPNLVAERARLARAQAVAAERRSLIEEGKVIAMEEAEQLFFTAARETRDAWTQWPGRVAHLIAHELGGGVDGDRLLASLKGHVDRQLRDLGEPDELPRADRSA